MTDHPFRFGIEEEYFLADADSGESPGSDRADAFHEAAPQRVDAASHEFLKGQVEVQTKPLTDFGEAGENLGDMRRALSGLAEEHGLTLFAAGAHPLAKVRDQVPSPDTRYRRLERELGVIAMRAMICATHIHVEAPEPDKRVELMNRIIPFLPLFYALSVSSPFWQARDSGLKGIRLSAFAEWPRMGLPEIFSSAAAYQDYVDLLVAADVVDDASFIWWHIRPSARFPTIELRVCDSCTRLDDVLSITALYRALVRRLARSPEINAGVGPVDRGVCASNIWLVQQHGVEASLIDVRRRAAIPVEQHLDEAIELVREDAKALGCLDHVLASRGIIERGTSADAQIAAFRDAIANGSGVEDAMRAVVKMLGRETVA
ncbi:carboxylate-amine ligase [Methylopila sp. M107]|uniref:carboxylate-amine ligase n=1 Tax=Methylopila sp. M107 TaxID=1101190 RepID=UPI00038185C4|nr:carboxylate-amine ligase [Methylopila sp. M107]